MSYESDRKLSLEELKQRNKPMQSAEPMPQTTPCSCPMTQQDLDELFEILIALQGQMKGLQHQNNSLQTRIIDLPTKSELEQVSRSLSRIQQTLPQAGSRKERSFFLPRLRLPTLEWSPIWIVIPLMLLALAVAWFSLGELWNGWKTLFP